MSLVIIMLAAAGHGLAGGSLDAPAGWSAVTAALTGVACVVMSGHEWTLTRLLLVLGVSQVVFHSILSAGHGMALTTTMTASDGTSMAAHGAVPLVPAVDAAAPYVELWMPMAHGAAALGAAVLLRSGERWALTALAFLAHVLLDRPLPRVLAVPSPRRPATSPHATREIERRVPRTSASRRGPPRSHACTA